MGIPYRRVCTDQGIKHDDGGFLRSTYLYMTVVKPWDRLTSLKIFPKEKQLGEWKCWKMDVVMLPNDRHTPLDMHICVFSLHFRDEWHFKENWNKRVCATNYINSPKLTFQFKVLKKKIYIYIYKYKNST